MKIIQRKHLTTYRQHDIICLWQHIGNIKYYKRGDNMDTTRARAGLRIPYEQNTKLILLSQKLGISKNALILQAIRELLEKLTTQKTA